MGMFNIQFHNFGEVKLGTTHCLNILYQGTEELTNSSFQFGCGCTSGSYDQNTKTLYVCLNMNNHPTKDASIICNIPEGQEVISLTASVTP